MSLFVPLSKGTPVQRNLLKDHCLGEITARPERRHGHCHVNFVRAALGRGADRSCVLEARLVMPGFESVRADGAIGVGCKLVSTGMEVTVDECVGGEEVLCLSG